MTSPAACGTQTAGHAPRNPLLAELAEGLARPQKTIAPKYFYDHRGSVLFDRITRLPEYYLLRAEGTLLPALARELARPDGPATLVELGAGKAEKTEPLLAAMLAARGEARFVPLDVSARYLQETADRLRAVHPGLVVSPVVADFTRAIPLPDGLPGPITVAFLGSTLGNFDTGEAIDLLQRVAGRLGPRDRFVIGVDQRKDPAVLEAAYNDSEGVTAEFNLNALRVLNRETGANFDPSRFRHIAWYDTDFHRIEMHLIALEGHAVRIPGLPPVRLRRGETIRTEISCKYDRASIEALCRAGGLRLMSWRASADGAFALATAAPA